MQVQFGKPAIGAKEYVSTTNTGWPEVYKRTIADAAVCAFLGPIPVDEAIANFLEGYRLARAEHGNKREILWGDISGYLHRIKGLSELVELPGAVAVGFWALVILELESMRNEGAN